MCLFVCFVCSFFTNVASADSAVGGNDWTGLKWTGRRSTNMTITWDRCSTTRSRKIKSHVEHWQTYISLTRRFISLQPASLPPSHQHASIYQSHLPDLFIILPISFLPFHVNGLFCLFFLVSSRKVHPLIAVHIFKNDVYPYKFYLFSNTTSSSFNPNIFRLSIFNYLQLLASFCK